MITCVMLVPFEIYSIAAACTANINNYSPLVLITSGESRSWFSGSVSAYIRPSIQTHISVTAGGQKLSVSEKGSLL